MLDLNVALCIASLLAAVNDVVSAGRDACLQRDSHTSDPDRQSVC